MHDIHRDGDVGDSNVKTRIYVSYVQMDIHGEWKLIEDACVLEFKHLFTRCSCFISEKDRNIVIVTGNYVEGFTEEGEECDTYINILNYSTDDDKCRDSAGEDTDKGNASSAREEDKVDESVEDSNDPENGSDKQESSDQGENKDSGESTSFRGKIHIRSSVRRNATEATHRNSIKNLYFTQDGTKLILISTNLHYIAVYSITNDCFGEPYEWDAAGRHNAQWYYYFSTYHKLLGNVVMICEADGKISMLRELNLNLCLLKEESFSLCDIGLPYGSFIFYHVQFFEDIVVYVAAGTPKQLFIVDCGGPAKRVVGKYVPNAESNIVEVNTNWSGEEVFLLMCTPNGFVLDVLFVSSNLSLKCLSKLAVLQNFSARDLSGMNLPRMLKVELNLSFFGSRMLNSKRVGH